MSARKLTAVLLIVLFAFSLGALAVLPAAPTNHIPEGVFTTLATWRLDVPALLADPTCPGSGTGGC